MVAELAALVIFVIMFLLIVLARIPRQWVTLGCGALMLVLVFGICMHDGGAIWEYFLKQCREVAHGEHR